MFSRQIYPRTCRFLLAWCAIGLLSTAVPQPRSWGQLQTLSAGDADQLWREAQLQAFDTQLADEKLPPELKREIKAQREWLEDWEPKPRSSRAAADNEAASSATDSSRDDTAKQGDTAKQDDTAKAKEQQKNDEKQKDREHNGKGSDEQKLDKDGSGPKEHEPLDEPIIDPDDLAKEMRLRLFDPKRSATPADTKALQKALSEHSGDVGLRQLQLHWIDQPTYRDAHWQEISNAADRVLALLSDLPASKETKAAAAYANYRKARALAHALRGKPLRGSKIAGADKLSEADREQMENAISECWRQIETLVGTGHSEFFQLEMYSLRRYGWSGQALELLERNASAVDELAYLSERLSILEALGWTVPAEQTAALIQQKKAAANDAKHRRLFEIQYVPAEEE